MNRFRKLTLLILLGLLCAALPACGEKVTLPEAVASVVTVKINPEISLFLNAAGEVVSVQPVNADGQQVLDAIDGDWGSGGLSAVVTKIVETGIAEGFLKEGGEVALAFYGDAGELSALQQTVDAALAQARQDAGVSFTVSDPAAAPIGKYRGEAPVFGLWDGYAVWDSVTRDENGILLSADGTREDGAGISLRYDPDRSETTITTLLSDGAKEICVCYANGQMKSETHLFTSGAEEIQEYYPDGTVRSYSYFDGDYGHRTENWPNGTVKLYENHSPDGIHSLSRYREDGTLEKSESNYPDGTYMLCDYYEDGKTLRHYEWFDEEGALNVEDFRPNGCRESRDITGPGSYVCHEDYNEEGRMMTSLATDPDTGCFSRAEYYPSGQRKFDETRDESAPSYRLEEYYENGILWHLVVEEPDGYTYTRVTDEAGNLIQEESTEGNGLHWLREILEDGRLHEYSTSPADDSIVESYGIPHEDGSVTYTYSYHKQGDDFLLIMEMQEDGGTRTETTDHGTYLLQVTYPDGTLRHEEIRQPHGLSAINDYRPDGSPSRKEEIYSVPEGDVCFLKEYHAEGGFRETQTDGDGSLVCELDVRADGSWSCVRRDPYETRTEEYVPGQYYSRHCEYPDGYQKQHLDASGHFRLETDRENFPDEQYGILNEYDGPVADWVEPLELEDFSHFYQSHFPD